MNTADAKRFSQERKVAIVAFTAKYQKEHGFPPTVREIGKAVGLASSSSVHAHIRKLEELGLMEKWRGHVRTYTVREDVLREMLDDPLDKLLSDPGDKLDLTVLGLTAYFMIARAEQHLLECTAAG